MKTFTCSICERTFESEGSEEESIQELQQHFGDVEKEECAAVCDSCYQQILTKYGTQFSN